MSFCSLMPCSHAVSAIRDILDLVFARFIRNNKIRRWRDDDIAGHLRMHVAEEGNHTRVIEFEASLFSLWPRGHIVTQLLVPTDRDPEDVVRHIVAVKKVNGCALLDSQNVRNK